MKIIIYLITLTLIIGLVILFISAISNILNKMIYKKCKSKVIETSQRYMDILQLNQKYNFHDIGPFLIWDTVLDSKSQYDQTDLDTFFEKMVAKNNDELKNYESSITENQFLLNTYDNEFEKIHDYTTKEYVKTLHLPWHIYQEIEYHICEKIRLHPLTHLGIKCRIYYTSPQGRNSYKKEHIYGISDVKRALQHLDDKKKFQESKEYQRNLMSNSLRYDILKRDGFRCVLCGKTANDGVALEVDHIIPVSKGGKTVLSNLRTLCKECNRGKSNKYNPDGTN